MPSAQSTSHRYIRASLGRALLLSSMFLAKSTPRLLHEIGTACLGAFFVATWLAHTPLASHTNTTAAPCTFKISMQWAHSWSIFDHTLVAACLGALIISTLYAHAPFTSHQSRAAVPCTFKISMFLAKSTPRLSHKICTFICRACVKALSPEFAEVLSHTYFLSLEFHQKTLVASSAKISKIFGYANTLALKLCHKGFVS